MAIKKQNKKQKQKTRIMKELGDLAMTNKRRKKLISGFFSLEHSRSFDVRG
jgi:hypothetical protein